MTTNRDVTLRYLDAFCAADVAGLRDLLTDDMQFDGSLFQYQNRDAYLHSLQQNPPERCTYTLLSLTEAVDTVAVFYLYEKPAHTLKLAQLFRFRNHKICQIDLVFDTHHFR